MTDSIKNEYRPDVMTPPGETLQEILFVMGMTKAGEIMGTSIGILI